MMTRKQILIPKQLNEKVEEKSKETGYSHSEIVRRALDKYLSGDKE